MNGNASLSNLRYEMIKRDHMQHRGSAHLLQSLSPLKAVILALLLVGLLASCVPEVVKYNTQGNAQYEEGAYPDALELYRMAQVSEPDLPEPYYNAANTYNRQGDVAGTNLQTEQALKAADPDLQANTWYNLGNAYYDAQQWQAAIEAYKSALRLHPDDADAKYNLELAMQAFQQQQNQDRNASEAQEKQDQTAENQDEGKQNNTDNTSPKGEDVETPTSPEPSETAEPGQQTGSEEQKTSTEQTQQMSEQTQQMPEQTQTMTAEQAQQLLEALLGDNETLQEHLQRYFQAPGTVPEEDW
jgi:Ca-activated chloride channel family protein